jgi:hypothetical protein
LTVLQYLGLIEKALTKSCEILPAPTIPHFVADEVMMTAEILISDCDFQQIYFVHSCQTGFIFMQNYMTWHSLPHFFTNSIQKYKLQLKLKPSGV